MIKKEDKYRFEFGKNWENYINKVGSFQVTKAMESFERFGIKHKSGKNFLDIGSGSGLFSLAAYKLGFKTITSFDYDLNSVNATIKLHQIFQSNNNCKILQGSVLDKNFLNVLG